MNNSTACWRFCVGFLALVQLITPTVNSDPITTTLSKLTAICNKSCTSFLIQTDQVFPGLQLLGLLGIVRWDGSPEQNLKHGGKLFAWRYVSVRRRVWWPAGTHGLFLEFFLLIN